MRKTAIFAGACAVLALVLSLASAGPSAVSRPAGVPANAWIPLTADAGFTGYLMARHDGKWVRLDPEGGARLVPMN